MRKLLAGKTGKASTNGKKKKQKNPFVIFTGLLLSSGLEILPEQEFVLLDNSDLFSPRNIERGKKKNIQNQKKLKRQKTNKQKKTCAFNT